MKRPTPITKCPVCDQPVRIITSAHNGRRQIGMHLRQDGSGQQCRGVGMKPPAAEPKS